MKKLAFDTETHRIGPGAIAPPMVCLSQAAQIDDGKQVTRLTSTGDGDQLRVNCELVLEPGHLLIGQNTAFDLAVLVTKFPELEKAVWDKLEAGEVTCTMIREQLLNLSTHGNLDFMSTPDGGRVKLGYSMKDLVLQYFGKDISGDKDDEDAWRTNYDTLDGVPSDKFPPDARAYAIDDAVHTLEIFNEQEKRVKSKSGYASLHTQSLHTAAHFALFLMTIRGMEVDPEEFKRVQKMLDAELAPAKLRRLIESGILRPGSPEEPYAKQRARAKDLVREFNPDATVIDFNEWREELEAAGIKFKKAVKPSINKKKLTALVEELCEEHRMPVKKTDKGGTCADAEVVANLSGLDDTMAEYEARQKLQKLVTTELPRMTWEGEIAKSVHFNFRPLLETGRTSSFASKLYPSGNGQQIDPRVRPCYKARDGHLLVSVDYSTLELCTTAQITYDLFGKSVHRDKINAGVDLHSFLGSQLALHLHADFGELCRKAEIEDDPDAVYAEFRNCKGHEDSAVAEFFAFYRKFAKPVGLGYPGGLGPITFISIAKKSYGVDIAEIASTMDQSEFEVTGSLLFYAKKLFGMTNDTFEWNGRLRAIALALKLRDIWLNTYPEMALYFKHVADNCGDEHNESIGERDDGRPVKGLCYTSPMGMHRAGASFTSVANGLCMQTPSAEGAKIACIMVTRACRDESVGSILYGSHPVDFVHDEILAEIPDDDKAHERVVEMQRIMEKAMQCVVSDVKIGTEGALMRRWDKRAEPVFVDGRLVVWEPKDG